MRNKEKVLYMLEKVAEVNSMCMSDDIIGGCDEVVDGWLRCQTHTINVMLNEIKSIIDSQEVEF